MAGLAVVVGFAVVVEGVGEVVVEGLGVVVDGASVTEEAVVVGLFSVVTRILVVTSALSAGVVDGRVVCRAAVVVRETVSPSALAMGSPSAPAAQPTVPTSKTATSIQTKADRSHDVIPWCCFFIVPHFLLDCRNF